MPFWALAYVFGRNAMYWYRLELSLGRNSVVGTTVRRAELPEHLLADEHHQRLRGEKTYVATTIAAGCYLGAELADSAGAEDLKSAYGVFRDEAQNVSPGYQPKTVNTDGWKSTQAAWRALFPLVAILQCFLHAWLKIRDRAKHQRDEHSHETKSFSTRMGGVAETVLSSWVTRSPSASWSDCGVEAISKKSRISPIFNGGFHHRVEGAHLGWWNPPCDSSFLFGRLPACLVGW